ncbi:RluA family pseudouridine synthase [Actomonas aquatica]|uniref:RluA family pseudouridine synthase n=1 Tax=Actomonas aquatica TaxID=2866162 RepID=A0ABZ1C1U5_9BACT|nr:RluA family pseudouridine synthase [Opitutus sp. WL0086]WRQ85601.1 RluA family pseudouridine synthase [Opitutus sp. WL0086]
MTSAAALDILFEDRDLLVVNKPSGLLTEGGGDREPDLEQRASTHCRRPVHACHRLDRLTSGVVLLRKTARLNTALAQLFEGHRLRKTYWALVDGAWDARIQKIETQIAPAGPGRCANVTTGGKTALTTVRVLGRDAGRPARTWLSLLLKTGRTHQARLHCLHGGCPVLGDPLYGSCPADAPVFGLHARELRFPHPATGEALTLTAEPPASWAPLLESLRSG